MSQLKKIDTTIGDDLEVTVEFEYDPPQAALTAPNDLARAPFPAEVRLCSVLIYTVDGKKVFDVLTDISDRCHNKLAQECLQAVEEGRA